MGVIINGDNFINVTFSGASESYFDNPEFCESVYISNILIHLKEALQERFYEFNFIIHFPNATMDLNAVAICDARKNVVLYLGDEESKVPHEVMKIDLYAVFKSYLPSELPYKNLFHLPLGYVNSTQQLPVVPPVKRLYNVFFSGALHWVRLPFLKQFTRFKFLPFKIWNNFYQLLKPTFNYNYDFYYPSSFIRFNLGGFKSGLNAESYSQFLYNSKIVICPRGIISYESYRHFEAMRAGCVVISESLPKTFFYHNSPIIFLDKWKQLDEVVNRLLDNPEELELIHKKTIRWWEEVCSEKAVAQYIMGKLLELETNN